MHRHRGLALLVRALYGDIWDEIKACALNRVATTAFLRC
jgi:hypothetical protein